ncbi:MAG: hypothetical protein ACREJB_19515, partial [Planctomycetaceae bacterium]
MLDFLEPSQGTIVDVLGNQMAPFDVTRFGFAQSEFAMVTDAVLEQVRAHYQDITTNNVNSLSPMPAGMQLDIDFVIGDLGQAPSNGAAEFYVMQIGDSVQNLGGLLGAAFLSSIRNATGGGPNFGLNIGDAVGAIYTNQIQGIGGLNPADITAEDDHSNGTGADVASGDGNPTLADALQSGNLFFTVNAISGTVTHEIGHAVSLAHLNKAGSVTPNGLPPIMGTGAIDLPNQDRIFPREFAISGFNAQAGGAQQFHIQQLINAIGLRNTPTTGGPGGPGGGPITGDSVMIVRNSTISNNAADSRGGGVFNEDALTIINSTISGNIAGAHGGGVLNDGTLDISLSTVYDNHSDSEGAGLFNNSTLNVDATVSIQNTIVAGSTGTTSGNPQTDVAGAFESRGHN